MAMSASAAQVLHNGSSSLTAHMLAAAMDWSLADPPPDWKKGGDDEGGPVFIDVPHLGLAVLVIIINGLLSIWLKLALHNKLAVATVRVVLQLSILGYILVPIFTINKAWLSCLYMCFMLLVAAIEGVSRPAQTYDGMLWQVLVALGASSSAILAYGLGIVIHPEPWYEAQYLIPVMGMLLGNVCSGVAVGLSTLLDDFSGGRDRIEQLLALGASRTEAARDAIRKAARMALTPTINQMNVAGIVAIPGMMTGQILGGADPTTAARYQIVLLLFIAATSGLGSVGAILLAVYTLLDHEHRLRGDRVHAREVQGKGVVLWVAAQLRKFWRLLTGKRRGSSRDDKDSSAVPGVVVERDQRGPEGSTSSDHLRERLLPANNRS